MNWNRSWLGFVLLLLFLELEYLVFTQEQLRTQLRALFHLPVYHVLLAFGLLLLITWKIAPARLRGLSLRARPGMLAVHALVYLGLAVNLSALANWTTSAPPGPALALWAMLGLILLATWLACWVGLEKGRASSLLSLTLMLLALALMLASGAQWTSDLWDSLAGQSFNAAHFFLRILFVDASVNSRLRLLGTSRFQVEVQPGCSGYEGLGLMLCLMLFYLFLKSRQTGVHLRRGRAVALVLGALLLSWCSNILRLVCLVALGTLYSPELAIGSFHSQAGWLLFSSLGLLLIGMCERTGFLEARAQAYRYPGVPYMAPMLTVILATILTQALASDFDTYYPLRPLLAGLCLLYYRDGFRSAWGRPDWRAPVAGVAAYLLWILLISPQVSPPPSQFLESGWLHLWIFSRLLGSVVVAPLSEELAFRAYLLRRMQQPEADLQCWPVPGLVPLCFSSALFGLIHQHWLAGFLVGLIYGSLLGPRSRLSNCLLAHATTNLCLCLQVLLTARWDLW